MTANDSNVHSHIYVMLDAKNREMAVACPDYASGEDPAVVGWPICRMPKVDHASVVMNGASYLLRMMNSQNYQLRDENGQIVVQIIRRSLAGGWSIDAPDRFSPFILCGIFAFCRYLEQENELFIV